MLGVSYCDCPVSSVQRAQFASNDISSIIPGQISTKVDRIVPLEVLYQNGSNHSALLHKMAADLKIEKSFKRHLLLGQWPISK